MPPTQYQFSTGTAGQWHPPIQTQSLAYAPNPPILPPPHLSLSRNKPVFLTAPIQRNKCTKTECVCAQQTKQGNTNTDLEARFCNKTKTSFMFTPLKVPGPTRMTNIFLLLFLFGPCCIWALPYPPPSPCCFCCESIHCLGMPAWTNWASLYCNWEKYVPWPEHSHHQLYLTVVDTHLIFLKRHNFGQALADPASLLSGIVSAMECVRECKDVNNLFWKLMTDTL